MIRLRMKLFRCKACGWSGQTYTDPETTGIPCPSCKPVERVAFEIPSQMNEAGNHLEPIGEDIW